MSFRIAVIPGDGIGQEVIPEGIRVVDAAAAASVGVRAAVRQVSPLRQPSAEGYFLVDLEFLDLDTRSSLAVERWLSGTPARHKHRRT